MVFRLLLAREAQAYQEEKRKLMIRKGAILRTHEKLETSLRTGTVFHVSFFIC